ncbi:MAG TPA: UDP-N-acetylmuramoyl-L-alanyl-D-glutamate--2,6-diaminopimelate ligase [Ferruginibacter sp.]|nr:UDP-N-acetylmuramoyl-L-alanyl-D-glutamate--2,6-diaminopimelate ligase [Chitinophagales bacterium]HMX35635.1 UDP-N-acetylmuramoyl-L-alanyl-D-glutamate--2,6-diaminopimelate ligase [Ferruginibacter sp.]HNJ28105.1 UDP-N-acetylmuramoyl-L-alanyl-D-glutamate--2,6-diaminopimelate ligase [Ferruginibacter sp.]HNL63935.1 UDP-N-acetylmuramoyl-L-alanyl-D-glutamate--2,6-diaminopimelate ligase [Ferruginibacter sp.]HNO98942.1 UDP-N-acetylmuramoyl-L-alanyl-D-glutamate--2,6-diaminopimelate ligase [Ferruginiba
MILQDVLYKVSIRSVKGDTSIAVNSIAIDSRLAKPGSCFIALKGTKSDGQAYIDAAIEKGATAIICESIPANATDGITYIEVENTAKAAGYISHNFFGEPSTRVKLVGVTGTNGKTTIATLLWKLFSGLGHTCGLISTVQNQVGDKVLEATHTTPDAVSINALLKQMVEAGCTHVFMECSSHAIHQYRIAGLQFAGALFTNITHDHLDYHKAFDEYIRVKKSWFDELPASAFAISNADDKRGAVMLQNCQAKKQFYSLKTMADFKGKILDNSLEGLHMTINDKEVYFRLIGEFNAYNLLAVYGAAVCLGEDKDKVLQVLSSLDGAEGRFDYRISKQDKITGIVDYAHTPDALLNVLATIKKLRRGHEKIITVVGCGGDRDKTKRPVMAEVACEYSDKVILTSDNPRSEDPLEILKDMESGLTVTTKKKAISIADRKEAIKTAVSLADKDDIILVAGKGHEKYQDIKGVKYDFDDKQVLNEMFELLEK